MKKVNILEDTKTRLKLEIRGETHTLCNALRKELWEDKDLIAAAYHLEHPMIGHPTFIVEHKKDAKKALHAAVARLIKKNEELKEKFKKLI
ncbi:DNA-directed RNA polymerase subunit L [Candidatus Woesearchaeota archaeon]|nr:DNA-directed RNA polymerase subunit L [Candidatus Woesearchaeota archaeon]